jgi:hypothetical protein
MNRRVTEGPNDEYRRQQEGLRRRSDWEHGPASRPDPDWEHAPASRPDPDWEHGPAARPDPDWESADDPLAAVRDLLGALLRRPRGRP